MSSPRTIAFCPECEREFPPDRERCPEDASELLEYQIVDEQPRDPLIGAVFEERFRVEEPLSQGGMGTVYRGSQIGVDRDVAIKVLEDEGSDDGNQVRRFLREARTISKLSHPNIVNFVDFGQDPEHRALYLVMELIEGCELSTLLDGNRLAPNFAVEVGVQMCSALTEPHHHGVIHRDLKPANLMLQTRLDGSVQLKLVDFGIANAVHQQTRLTQTGVACGTPHYMAPEQVEGGNESPAIDIYGLGAIFFRMLTGRVVFDANTDVQILFKHVKEAPPDLSQSRYTDELPDALIELVHEMLAKSPEARPESMLDVRDRLREIRGAQPGWGAIEVDAGAPTREALETWVIPREGDSPVGTAPQTGQRGERRDTAESGRPDRPGRVSTSDGSVEQMASAAGSGEMPAAASNAPPSRPAAERSDTIQQPPEERLPSEALASVDTSETPDSEESEAHTRGATSAEVTTQRTSDDEDGAPVPVGRTAALAGVLAVGVGLGIGAFYLVQSGGSEDSTSKTGATGVEVHEVAPEGVEPSASPSPAAEPGEDPAVVSGDTGTRARRRVEPREEGSAAESESPEAKPDPAGAAAEDPPTQPSGGRRAETPDEESPDEQEEPSMAPAESSTGASGGASPDEPSPTTARDPGTNSEGESAGGSMDETDDEVDFEPVPHSGGSAEEETSGTDESSGSDSIEFEPVPGD